LAVDGELRARTPSKTLQVVASEPRLGTPNCLKRLATPGASERVSALASPKQYSLAVSLELATPKARQMLMRQFQSGREPSPDPFDPSPLPSFRRQPPGSPLPSCRPQLSALSRPVSQPRPLTTGGRSTVTLAPLVSPRVGQAGKNAHRRMECQKRVEEMKSKFKELNISGDGYLDLAQLTVLLRRGRADITEREVATLFCRIDTNGDGRISFEEFVDYIFSVELSAKRATKRKSTLNKWEGPEQLQVNGVWDTETKSALQRFLLEQRTATGNVAKPQSFISGQMNTQQVVVLQEVLMQQRTPTALKHSMPFVCGKMTPETTRALHEFLLAEETPTAMQHGQAFVEQDFGEASVFALQELLVMYRRGRGTGLHAAR